MSEKKGLVPRLRFPEFREGGKWERKPIGDVCESFSGGTPSTTRKDYYGGATPFIRSAEIGAEKTELFLTKEGLASSAAKLVKRGDVLVALYGANSGDVALAKTDGAINQAILCLRTRASNGFIFNYLSLLKKWIITTYLQGGQGNLSGEIIKSIYLFFPQLEEQKRIADCLSALDTLIAARADKLDAIKTHKQGLMQRLFPREGETVPRLRFPEFRETGEWKESRLSQLIERVSIPVDVEPQGTYREIGIRSHGKGIFHKEAVSGKSLGDKRVFWVVGNAFVVNIVFAWERAIAVTSGAEDGMIASHRFPMYQASGRKADVHFLKYFFLTNTGKHLLGVASPGGAGRNKTLGQKEFEKLEVRVPANVEEQRNIAACLSSLDTLIAAQADKLEALKVHKQGLMQQLFPNPEAVAA